MKKIQNSYRVNLSSKNLQLYRDTYVHDLIHFYTNLVKA